MDREALADGLDDDGRNRIYSLLFWMACCDEELHPREREALDRWAGLLGVSEQARLEEEVRQRTPLHLNATKPELDLLVRGLVEIVAADGVLDPAEQQRLSTLADLLGITQQAIEASLREAAPGLEFR